MTHLPDTKKRRKIRSSSGFEDKEQTGFFQISKKAAASAIINRLTGTQCRLWLYLMMIHPFADITCDGHKKYHPIPSPQDIAKKIGASVGTVEKDMRKLKKLQLYHYLINGWRGYNQSAAQAQEESKRLKSKKVKSSAGPRKGLNKSSTRLNNPQEELNSLEKRLNNPSKKPETHDLKKVQQSLQTYSDFIRSLSEDERENFLDFVKDETRNLERPINDLEAWLASPTKTGCNRWEVYYQNYENYRVNESKREAQLDPRIAEFENRI